MGTALPILLALIVCLLGYGIFWNFFKFTPKRSHYCRVCVDYWAGRRSLELMYNFTEFPTYTWNGSWPNCELYPYEWVVDPIGCIRIELETVIPNQTERFKTQMFIPLSLVDDMPNGTIPVDKFKGNRSNLIYEVAFRTPPGKNRMTYTFCYNRACFLETVKNLPMSFSDRQKYKAIPTVVIPFDVPTTTSSALEPIFEPQVLPILIVIFCALLVIIGIWKCISWYCEQKRYIVV